LVQQYGCRSERDWQRAVAAADVDVVVAATPHKYLAEISAAALQAGKHVFCEKPAGRSPEEAWRIVAFDSPQASGRYGFGQERGEATFDKDRPKVVIGFTLRHHPPIIEA
jgi:predicted dehydrogenase